MSSGRLHRAAPSGVCNWPSQGKVIGQNGDELCVETNPLVNDPDRLIGAAQVIRYNPEPGYWNAAIPDPEEYPREMLPGVLSGLCDAYQDECDSVVVASIRAVANSFRCDGIQSDYPDGMSDAIRHITWSYSIAWRFHHMRGYTKQQAMNRARIWLWTKEQERNQTGCQSPPPGSSEEMDCNNNEIGLGLFDENPDLGAVSVPQAVWSEAHSNPEVIVMSGPQSCPLIPYP